MNNLPGLSSCFYREHTVEKWQVVYNAGITEAEISPNSALAENITVYLEESKKQYNILTKAGMNISSFHLPFGKKVDISGPGDEIAEKAIDTLTEILDWVGEKKINIAVLHGSFEPIRNEERGARLDRAKKSIKILGEYGKEKGITLAIEDLPRSCLGNCADELLELIDHGKNAKICFDVNHLLQESHKQFFQKTAQYIITTHFSDYDGVDEKHWIPGEGIINWKELIELFSDAGYSGRYLFEMEGIAKSSPRLKREFSPKELISCFNEAAGLKIGIP